jgi:hypothetical protein
MIMTMMMSVVAVVVVVVGMRGHGVAAKRSIRPPTEASTWSTMKTSCRSTMHTAEPTAAEPASTAHLRVGRSSKQEQGSPCDRND